jgi:DNA-binding XRE family transcriptional regulator
MYEQRKRYKVTKMARVIGVSRSGYYAWKERKPSRHEREDRELLDLIWEIYEGHHKR